VSHIPRDKDSKSLVEEMGNFTPIPKTFIEQSRGLSFHARWLFVVLSYYRNRESGKAFPSYDTIHELTGMRREMIARSIQQLESGGWLTRRKRFSSSTLYTLNFHAPSTNSEQGAAVSDVNEDREEAVRRSDTIPPITTADEGIPLAELRRVFSR
jgi:hypothetical protein